MNDLNDRITLIEAQIEQAQHVLALAAAGLAGLRQDLNDPAFGRTISRASEPVQRMLEQVKAQLQRGGG